MDSSNRQRVVVVGGGYAGVIAALRVAGRSRRRASVTLVDPKERFVQRLRLHQVAAGQEVSAPLYRKLLGRRVQFLQDTVELIDAERGRLELRARRSGLPFDHVIYAAGSATERSSIAGIDEYAHNVGDVEAARRLRGALAGLHDGAVVAVVGGGMTGVEVAAELATAYPALTVTLVSCGDFGSWLSTAGREYLRSAFTSKSVDVIDHVRVSAVRTGRLLLADGGELAAGAVVWCGGFRAPSLGQRSGLECDALGRVVVDRTLRSISHPYIVAAGDCAATPPFVAGAPLRMCCQAAMPAAAHAGETVLAEIKSRDAAELRFGYVHQPISLGRRDGLIQFVDRGDRPTGSILTGRRAAIYKELITAGAIRSIKLERLLPGATRWPFREPDAQRQLPAGANVNA